MRTAPDPAALYPDVAAEGSLASALQVTAAGQGLSLVAVPTASDLLRHASVLSSGSGREALRVSAAHAERRWLIMGCGRGNGSGQAKVLVGGETRDLRDVCRVAVAWRDGVPLSDIEQLAAWVELSGRYEVPDDSPAHLIASEWEYCRKDARFSGSPEYQTLIEATYAHPVLRHLYPFTSHGSLLFSSVVPTVHATPEGQANSTHSFSDALICLQVWHRDRYLVRKPFYGPVLAEATTAEEAAIHAARLLPGDLGQPVSSGD
ncbi:DUF6193 family natural product biosynthesis protein [Catellatospora citrea]|uniref:DUF6193 family natural product biosynthesis protein n=1 Tax=Catellatospora citrea TaxID=53366 RepID=UPI00341084BE